MHGAIDPSQSQPRWRTLYAVTAAVLTLFGVVDTFVAPGAWRRALEIVVSALLFAAMHVWVRANRRALASAAREPSPLAPGIVTVINSRDSKDLASEVPRELVGRRERWTSSISH